MSNEFKVILSYTDSSVVSLGSERPCLRRQKQNRAKVYGTNTDRRGLSQVLSSRASVSELGKVRQCGDNGVLMK